ncbi:hypothetical protein C2W62_38250, partial [Candidatus Entotheonella serta]
MPMPGYGDSQPKGRKRMLPHRIHHLVALLQWRAQHQPDQQACTFLLDGEIETTTMTYAELDRQARIIGAYLQHQGATNQPVLVIHPPGLAFVTAFLGCLYAGAIAVPTYPPRLRRRALDHRFQAVAADSQTTLILTTAAQVPDDAEHQTGGSGSRDLRWIATDHLPDEYATAWQVPEIKSETLAFLQYTSGSTSTPKGVMVSHGNLMHNLDIIHRAFGNTTDSHAVIWLPSYHDMGLIGGILQPLYVGFPTTLMSPLDFLRKPVRWLQAISRYRGTVSGGPNFAYDLCVQQIAPAQRATLDLSSWQVAFNGAEPIRVDTLERFTDAFAPYGFRHKAWYPCYGLAEGTLMVSGGIFPKPPPYKRCRPLSRGNTAPVTRNRNCLRHNASSVAVGVDGAKLFASCTLISIH